MKNKIILELTFKTYRQSETIALLQDENEKLEQQILQGEDDLNELRHDVNTAYAECEVLRTPVHNDKVVAETFVFGEPKNRRHQLYVARP